MGPQYPGRLGRYVQRNITLAEVRLRQRPDDFRLHLGTTRQNPTSAAPYGRRSNTARI